MVRRDSKRMITLFMEVCACVACLSVAARAQQPVPLPIEDALQARSFGGFGRSSMDFSPDGKWFAYVIHDNRRSKSADREASFRTGIPSSGEEIYVTTMKKGNVRNLTGESSDSWLPVWSPDGRYLAFLSDRDGSKHAKLWIWDTVQDSLKRVSDSAVSTDKIEWMGDSRHVLLTAISEVPSVEDHAKKGSVIGNQEAEVGKTLSSTVVVYRSSAIVKVGDGAAQSDPWNLELSVHDLVLADVISGKTLTLVHDKRIATYSLSPDGSQVAYTIPERFEKAGSQQILYDLVTLDISRNQERVLASNIRLDYDGSEFSWSPDGKMVSYHTGGGGNKINDCYVVSIAGGEPRNVTNLSPPTQRPKRISSVPLWDDKGGIYFIEDGGLWRTSVDMDKAVRVAEIPGRKILDIISQSENQLWTSDHGKSAVVVTHDELGKQDGFYGIELLSGDSKRLLEKGQCYTCAFAFPHYRVGPDGQEIAYFAEDAQHGEDIWTGDYRFEDQKRLTHLNPQFDEIAMGSARLVDWLSDDGRQLHGALLLPSNYHEGQRYPLLVWVYASGLLSDHFDQFGVFAGWAFNMQLFATRGYAVLLPDSPQEPGTPMADLAKTVLPGVNKVIEMGIADPNKLGVMGQSNGGYSTMALIVQTKRFKAAMEADGMADLIGMYGEMDQAGTAYGTPNLEHGQDRLGGTPWEFRERYIENSPIFYLDRVETPLLILHGAEDTEVAPFLGDQVFVGLRRLGKEVEYAKYKGEGHSFIQWSYANQVDLCDRMIGWFDKYLKAESPK
jgi:dipeptidyl aminopeptidase/acylaminoacyl peptidase